MCRLDFIICFHIIVLASYNRNRIETNRGRELCNGHLKSLFIVRLNVRELFVFERLKGSNATSGSQITQRVTSTVVFFRLFIICRGNFITCIWTGACRVQQQVHLTFTILSSSS